MTQKTFNKLQDLAEDLASSDGVGYNSFEQEFIENLEGLDADDKLSVNQEIRIDEIWNEKVRYK